MGIEGKKILWVEDDQILGGLVSKDLSLKGASMFYAEDGNTAIDVMKKEKPDIVLCDIILPGMNGFEIIQKMKSDDNLKDVPVIFFSALDREEDIKKAMELGAVKFLAKSKIVPYEVPNIIAEVLNGNTQV